MPHKAAWRSVLSRWLGPLVALAIGMGVASTAFNNQWSRPLTDWQRRALAPAGILPGVLMVDIDEQSLADMAENLGTWPYHRDIYALAVDELRAAGARAVVLDLLLADTREGDEALAREIRRPGAPVLLAAVGQAHTPGSAEPPAAPSGATRWNRFVLPDPLLRQAAAAAHQERQAPTAAPSAAPSAAPATAASPAAARGTALAATAAAAAASASATAAQVGLVTQPLDSDGVLRSLPLWHLARGQRLPAMPLAVWQALHPGQGLPAAWQAEGDGASLELVSAGTAVHSLPFAQVMRTALHMQARPPLTELVQGRVVFLGASAALADHVATPAGQLSGVETLAQAYWALENGPRLHTAWAGLNIGLVFLAAVPVWVCTLRGRVRQRTDVLWTLGVAALLLACMALASLRPMLVHSAAAWITLLVGALFTVVSRQRQLVASQVRLRTERSVAEAASRAKSEFLANVSHELRTPLNALLGAAELLERTRLDDRQRSLVGMFRTAGQTLQSLLNDLLDLAKIEDGHIELVLAPFSLRASIEHVMLLVRERATQKGLALHLLWDPECPEGVLGDHQRLEQMLANLLVNAVKFTAEGSVSLQVLRHGETLQVDVIDTGIGIATQQLDLIFEPFRQADGSVTRQFGGTGLGLTIVRRLARMMDGEVSVRSDAGRGSVFSLRLRLPACTWPTSATPSAVQRAGLAPLTSAPSSSHAIAAAGHPDVPMDFGGARLLLAEDNDINVQLFCAMLEGLGLRIEVARDGAAALAMLRQDLYAIAFIDIQMPVMDGLQLTRALRRLEADEPTRPRLPVVALTANAYASDQRASQEAGCDLHLSKPYERRQLVQALLRWLTPKMTTQAQQTAPSTQALGASTDLVDEAATIARLGSVALYQRARNHAAPYLAAWSAEYNNAHQPVQDQSKKLDLAHNLKSIAGSLGAQRLAGHAAALEQRLRQHPSADETEELAQVLAALAPINEWLGSGSGSGSGSGTGLR